jgi:hypothetical protein
MEMFCISFFKSKGREIAAEHVDRMLFAVATIGSPHGNAVHAD